MINTIITDHVIQYAMMSCGSHDVTRADMSHHQITIPQYHLLLMKIPPHCFYLGNHSGVIFPTPLLVTVP